MAIKLSVKYSLTAPFDFGSEGEIKEIILNCPRGRDLKGLSLELNIDPDAKTFVANYDVMSNAVRRCCSEPAFADLMYMPDVLGAYQEICENFTIPS
jgi:hypothetical protein